MNQLTSFDCLSIVLFIVGSIFLLFDLTGLIIPILKRKR